MKSGMKRRTFLGAAGTTAIVSLSGCSSPSQEESDDLSDVNIAKPVVASDALKGWTEGKGRKMKFASKWATTAYGNFRTFENTAFRERISDLTLGEFDNPLAKFFAAHVDLRGLATAAVTPTMIADEAKPELRANMKRSGIQNIREVEPKSSVPDLAKQTREYLGEFRYDGFSTTVQDEKAGEITLEMRGGVLPVRGFISTWKDGTGTGFATGGAYPAGPFNKRSKTSVTGELGTGLDLALIANLEIEPPARRAEILKLCNAVTLDSESSAGS